MKIIVDSATLYSPKEGRELGITIVPVCVAINDKTYKDYEEISSAEFLQLIEDGGTPSSSQPSLGDVLEVLETSEEEVLYLTVGDGLSGAYQTVMGARNCIQSNEHIHVVNSKSLAGPLRYLAKKAVSLKDEGLNIEKIKAYLQQCIETSVSFVVPADFDFLKRTGRLTPIAAKIGGVLKLLPVLTQTENKTRITIFSIKRSWKTAIEAIINHFQSLGIDENYLISISHAGTYKRALDVLQQVKERFRNIEIEILELSPALITHGGPGCIVIQAIKM